MHTENFIESIYRELAELHLDYIELYNDFNNQKLSEILSTLHFNLIEELRSLNSRLPTRQESSYYHAADSRRLLSVFEIIERLQINLEQTKYKFDLDTPFEKYPETKVVMVNRDYFLVKETAEEIIDKLSKQVIDEYENKIKDIPEEIHNEFEKVITLQVLDNYWMEHINTMSHLREGIHLRGYAQEDPLRAYTIEGYDLFDSMMQKIDKDVSIFLIKAEIRQNIERKEVSKKKITNESEEGTKQKPKRVKKVGRNDPCPCGSGKKYKQCCGK